MANGLIKLRAQLKEVVTRLMEGGPVSNDDIIKEIRRTSSSTINAASRELEDIALRRMINDLIARRKRIPKMPAFEDIFGNPPPTPALFSIRDRTGGAKRIKFGDVDLDVIIEAFSEQPNSIDEDREKFVRWLVRLRSQVVEKGLSYNEAVEIWNRQDNGEN